MTMRGGEGGGGGEDNPPNILFSTAKRTGTETSLHHVRALSLWFSLDLCRLLHCCLDREV